MWFVWVGSLKRRKKIIISIKYLSNSSCLLFMLLSRLACASPHHTLCEGKYIQSGSKGLERIHFKCCWLKCMVGCHLMWLLLHALAFSFIHTCAFSQDTEGRWDVFYVSMYRNLCDCILFIGLKRQCVYIQCKCVNVRNLFTRSALSGYGIFQGSHA